ncbi:MAG: PAS domain S-box protein, partial [Bacteroidia bacterium]
FFEFHVNPVLHLSGILKEVKLDFKKNNGSLINVLVNLRVVHDEGNELKEIQVTVFDFTQRENFEKEILQTNKKYAELVEKLQEQNQQIKEINSRIEALLQDTPIGVFEFTLDAKGKMDFTYANDEFYGIFSPILDKAKQIDVEILISHICVNDRERVVKSIYDSYENMTLFKEEFEICFNEKEKISLRFISHPISKVEGKVVWNGSVENITEKKALVDNLHFFKQGFADKKSRFELLTSFNKIGYWELNIKTGEGIVNHVFYSLLDRKLPENIFENKTNFFEEYVMYLHPDDLENFSTTRKDFEKNNSEYFEFEGRMLHNKGNWIWIWTKASLVKEGTQDLLIGTCIDITQQKELEEKELKNNEILKENNKKYEEILNNSSDLIFSLDSNLKIDFVNKTWLCKTLYDESEIIGQPVLNFIDNSEKDNITQIFNQLSFKETVLEVEMNMLNKQGKKLSCLAKLSSTFSSGTGLNIRGYLKDITEEKEVSLQLDQTLNNIKDGYAFIDSNFNILEWNKSAERILNLEKKLVYNKNIFELFPEMANSYLFNKVKGLFDSKLFGDFEYFSANLNTWLHLIFTPTLSGMAILFSDITERKRQEGLLRLETNVYSNYLNNTNEDIDGLLETICKQIKEFHPLMIFSTLKVINSRIYNWISPDLPQDYLKDIEGASIGPKVGSCGTAAYIKKDVIVEDIFNDKLWEDYMPLAIKYNLGACWSFPIFSEENEVIATFAIYHKTQKLMSSAEFNTIDKVRFLIQSLLQINSSKLKH